jgi:hypothetical protein
MDPRAFLDGLSLGQYAAAFVDNGVDASNLASLTDDDLKDLGVAALMHRKKILVALATLGGVVEPPRAASTSGLDLDALPFPVAHPLAFARDSALLPTERLNNALFAAYQAMRTTGLLLLADYLDVDASDRAVGGAIGGLRMPHWGEWTELNNKLVAVWKGRAEAKPERPSRFSALVDGGQAGGIDKAAGDLKSLLEGLPGMQGPAKNANDAIWKLLNDRAHRMATHTPDRSDEEHKLAHVLLLVDGGRTFLLQVGLFEAVTPLRDGASAGCESG